MKSKHGSKKWKCTFSHHTQAQTVILVVNSRTATAESPDSTFGLRYQPWHCSCVNIQLKKLNHNTKEKIATVIFSYHVLALPVFIGCWQQGRSGVVTSFSEGAEIAGFECGGGDGG